MENGAGGSSMILLINICKEKLHFYEFVKPVGDILVKNNIKGFIKHYTCLTKRDLEKASKIIICGTSLNDDEFLTLAGSFDWIRDFDKPLLGICGGSHLIGFQLGYKRKNKKEIGLKEIDFTEDFLGIKGKKEVYHLHKYQYLPSVFKHPSKNTYATVFHPEVRNKEIILNFCRM
jgi:GMP synthase (glutamine-hydrolysing)